MIEQILPSIRDPEDYITVLSLFKADAPLTAEEAERLLAVYAKYLPEADEPEYLKLCLAADLLPGRQRGDAAFDALELSGSDLDALFAVKEIVSGSCELSQRRAAQIAETVRGGEASLPVRVLLARVALDAAAASREIAAMRQEAAALAQFLTGCGTGTLDRYTALVGEVRMKCRS